MGKESFKRKFLVIENFFPKDALLMDQPYIVVEEGLLAGSSFEENIRVKKKGEKHQIIICQLEEGGTQKKTKIDITLENFKKILLKTKVYRISYRRYQFKDTPLYYQFLDQGVVSFTIDFFAEDEVIIATLEFNFEKNRDSFSSTSISWLGEEVTKKKEYSKCSLIKRFSQPLSKREDILKKSFPERGLWTV